MITDIVFTQTTFILEVPIGAPGGIIGSYSLDGPNYDFVSSGGETSSIFIS